MLPGLVSTGVRRSTLSPFRPIQLTLDGDTLRGPEQGWWYAKWRLIPSAVGDVIGWHGPKSKCGGALVRTTNGYSCAKCSSEGRKFLGTIPAGVAMYGEWRKHGARKFGKRKG